MDDVKNTVARGVYTLIFLDRQRAQASWDLLKRLGSEPDGSVSPSTLALRFRAGAGGAGGVASPIDGVCPCTAAISG